MTTAPITIADGRVIIRSADGTIWMTKHQIANLFECFVAKAVSNIAAILKSGVLDESRVCRFHRYRDGGGVEMYSLEMIVALAFRIDTHNAVIFRRWLMERAMQPTQPPVSVFLPWSETDISSRKICRNETN